MKSFKHIIGNKTPPVWFAICLRVLLWFFRGTKDTFVFIFETMVLNDLKLNGGNNMSWKCIKYDDFQLFGSRYNLLKLFLSCLSNLFKIDEKSGHHCRHWMDRCLSAHPFENMRIKCQLRENEMQSSSALKYYSKLTRALKSFRQNTCS